MFERLNSIEFRAIWTDELKYLFALFKKNSYEIRIAGGAVRDLLMGFKPNDIDFATTATPDQMKELFEKENIRMINTNGEKHGTITVRLGNENYEITTLRIDVVTDGRHAQVQFTQDWKLDANRRDLTINSIFLDEDGSIVDFFNGYDDIKHHRIKFVGEPNARIQEDYLRILRYFRFYSRICLDEHSHDIPSLEAIKANSAGLSGIAGERIWVEYRKIVCSKFADSIMKHMIETNVHKYIGLPDDCNLEEFSRVYKIYENNLENIPQPITMVCSLLRSTKQFENLLKRLKFSNEEKRIADFLFMYRDMTLKLISSEDAKNEISLDEKLKPFKFILVDFPKDATVLEKLIELLKYVNRFEYMKHLEVWKIPVFPINGEILKTKNIPKGPLYSKILNTLKEIWKNEFNLDTSNNTFEKLMKKCDELIT